MLKNGLSHMTIVGPIWNWQFKVTKSRCYVPPKAYRIESITREGVDDDILTHLFKNT
jgi:hypothetical protein